jgi:hypothetical protein
MRTKVAFTCILLVLANLPMLCWGQWLTQQIALVPGWNAVYLEVQPEPSTCEQVFGNLPIESVWKWDRRFSTIQFTVDPATLLPESPDWLVWLPPSDPRSFLNRLSGMQGCQAYLIKVATNAAPFTLALKGRVLLPRLEWYPHGLNLVGFPVHSHNPPTFTDFFRHTTEVDTSRSYNNELYRLDAQGRGQRIVQPARERLQPGVAYWIGCSRAPVHQSALHVLPEGATAVDFGSLLVQRDITIRNVHPTNSITIRVRQQVSEAPPTSGNYAELAGPVPLSTLSLNASNQWVWSNFPAEGLSRVLKAGDEFRVRLGVRRGDMTPYTARGMNGATYQSYLEVTDAGESLRIRVPVTANKAETQQSATVLEAHDEDEGLWVGQVTVNQANAPAYTTNLLSTPAPLSFRLLVHRDGYGTARLLQEVVLAWDPSLTNAPHTNGAYALYVDGRTLPANASDVSRIASAAFPIMSPVTLAGPATNSASTNVVATNVLTGRVTVRFDDPTNPFLHRYHPLHDNRDWNFRAYTNAVEVPTIVRDITLRFDAATSSSDNPYYGVDMVSGGYQETLTGLRAQPIVLQGAFSLRRISRIGELRGLTL